MVVSTIIGTGVFLVAAPMARAAGSIDLVVVAWLAGTVIALSGMLCFAELGATLPQAGGLFAYLTRGLGPLWGFLFGWGDSLLIGPTGLATLAAGFAMFAGFLFPGLSAPWLTLDAGHHVLTLTAAQPLAAAVVLSLVALNCLSINVGGSIQLVLSSLKIAATVLIIVAGFLLERRLPCKIACPSRRDAEGAAEGTIESGLAGELMRESQIEDAQAGRCAGELPERPQQVPLADISGEAAFRLEQPIHRCA